jgi:cytochrome c553
MNKTITLAIATMLATPVIMLADMDRCVSCHGVDFEKSALGVSKIVKDMSEKEIKIALDGYKAGKGGSMKALMIQEVNLGVDTDAMAADVYNESRTPGFDEPEDEFIFQKRFTVRSLDKIKKNIKKADPKKDMPKISSQIKSTAFSLYTYDKLLQTKLSFADFKPKKMTMKDIMSTVTNAKTCVDHSFTYEEIEKCTQEFVNLAGTLVKNEENKMKAKSKKAKAPVYTGAGAVNLDKYLKHTK